MGRAAVPDRVVPKQPPLSYLFSPGEVPTVLGPEESKQRSLRKEMGEVGTLRPEHPSQDAQICSGQVWEPQGGWSHSQKLCWRWGGCSQIKWIVCCVDSCVWMLRLWNRDSSLISSCLTAAAGCLDLPLSKKFLDNESEVLLGRACSSDRG